MHVYRWDLDRTYLETEIHSMRGLVRAAFEPAGAKRTVAGAAELARGLLDSDREAQLFVLSGSPRQMRRVLREKLALDGVRVDRLVLKDNLRNLRRGRLRALRGQVGYKLPALLMDRAQREPSVTETLFGDDSETDAVVYAVYAELVAGRMGRDDLVALLERGRAYPDAIERSLGALAKVQHAEAVEEIFIRVDRGVPPGTYRQLGDRVYPVFSWWQAALTLRARGRLSHEAAVDVAVACGIARRPEFGAGLAQDAVRRGLASADVVMSVLEAPALADAASRVGRALAGLGVPEPARRFAPPDYQGFLDALDRL